MTWSKLGDEYSDETWTLSDAAYRLHTDGLVWSNRKLLDGKLPKDDLARCSRRPEAVGELVSVGFWEDQGDHYRIVHHIGYQRTREQVVRQSIVNANNRAQGTTRPIRPKDGWSDRSSDRSSDERDRTGQDRQGRRNRGTSLSDELSESEHAALTRKADEITRWAYDR
jgi:hypothetical protein